MTAFSSAFVIHDLIHSHFFSFVQRFGSWRSRYRPTSARLLLHPQRRVLDHGWHELLDPGETFPPWSRLLSASSPLERPADC
jgi:hypothetical protein